MYVSLLLGLVFFNPASPRHIRLWRFFWAGGKKTCQGFQGTLFQAEVALAQLKYPPLSARREDR